jgi:hypothetical protein
VYQRLIGDILPSRWSSRPVQRARVFGGHLTNPRDTVAPTAMLDGGRSAFGAEGAR